MSTTEFFAFPSTRRRVYAGPLGPYIDEFTDRLQQRGYSTNSIRTKIRVVSNLSRWLASHDFGPADVNADRLKRFLAIASERVATLPMMQRLYEISRPCCARKCYCRGRSAGKCRKSVLSLSGMASFRH